MSAWTEHVERWRYCTDCQLCEQRDQIVLARGSIPADIVFVGEAPGESENTIGQPFVGRAGKLLDEIIERTVPCTLKYALTNLVACFPAEAKNAGINEPEQYEIESCRGRLVEFLNIASPKLIVCVGRLSSDNIPSNGELKKHPLYVDIVHPAAILRMPSAQQQMAVQKCIVVLRNAIGDMTERDIQEFTKKENNNAGIKSKQDIYKSRESKSDDDIPF